MYWELELYNGSKMILLMLYWDDYKQTSKRTHKVNAFYLCILNDEKNFHIYPITYVPSGVDVNIVLENIITPSLRCLGKGVTINSQKYLVGVHGCVVDHIAKLSLVLMKNSRAMYFSVYDHRLSQKLSCITKELYKPHDSRLHKLLFD